MTTTLHTHKIVSRQYPYPIGPDPAYAVNLWGSKPGTNDDCHTGASFVTRGQAQQELRRVVAALERQERVWCCSCCDTQYVELDGPDVHIEVRISTYRPSQDDDWQREFAMQQGMAFGCAGYNDAYGW